jgi:ABC-2 type transport system ATP-binding protein
MIEIKEITKTFGATKALNEVSFNIEAGSVFGLVGSNGAGKSTLLRIMAGVFEPDSGNAYLDGETPFENNALKEKTAFVSDFPYFYSGATLDSMAQYYKDMYSNWDDIRFTKLKAAFPIDPLQKISTMSKGMQRQSAIILALSYNPEYILFDEVFDGLDPVIRELVKRILIDYVDETGATVIIAGHNLRELEGFCDHIGLLHLGGILMEKDIDSEAMGMFRVQFVLPEEASLDDLRAKLNIVKESNQGKMIQMTVKGNKDEIDAVLAAESPVFLETLPLTLEEVFISEMEVAGYDISKFQF